MGAALAVRLARLRPRGPPPRPHAPPVARPRLTVTSTLAPAPGRLRETTPRPRPCGPRPWQRAAPRLERTCRAACRMPCACAVRVRVGGACQLGGRKAPSAGRPLWDEAGEGVSEASEPLESERVAAATAPPRARAPGPRWHGHGGERWLSQGPKRELRAAQIGRKEGAACISLPYTTPARPPSPPCAPRAERPAPPHLPTPAALSPLRPPPRAQRPSPRHAPPARPLRQCPLDSAAAGRRRAVAPAAPAGAPAAARGRPLQTARSWPPSRTPTG